MKTSDLIEALAANAAPVKAVAPVRRLLLAAALGAAVALCALVLWLGLQPLAPAMRARWFWMKAGYGLVLAIAGGTLLLGLARPGARPRWMAVALGSAAIGLMGVMSLMDMARTAPQARLALWMGHSWDVCPFRIAVLAIPVFVALVWALRRLAPTRLALSGAVAGLTAGAVASCVYGLYCQETAAPFVATWYTVGIGLCALAGAVLGRRVLRW